MARVKTYNEVLTPASIDDKNYVDQTLYLEHVNDENKPSFETGLYFLIDRKAVISPNGNRYFTIPWLLEWKHRVLESTSTLEDYQINGPVCYIREFDTPLHTPVHAIADHSDIWYRPTESSHVLVEPSLLMEGLDVSPIYSGVLSLHPAESNASDIICPMIHRYGTNDCLNFYNAGKKPYKLQAFSPLVTFFIYESMYDIYKQLGMSTNRRDDKTMMVTVSIARMAEILSYNSVKEIVRPDEYYLVKAISPGPGKPDPSDKIYFSSQHTNYAVAPTPKIFTEG